MQLCRRIIASSDDQGYSQKKNTCKVFLLIFILFIGTFAAALVTSQLLFHDEEQSPNEAHAAGRSLKDRKGIFRQPIGGQLNCNPQALERSLISPVNAHRVRPSDVQYIAAMGDSLTTAFLSYTSHEEEVDELRNYVGNSFIMGGDGAMEEHLTLANILRRLSPSIIGYSTGQGLEETQTNLNVALPGMWVNDMPRQAEELIRKFAKYPPQSLREDWKLISIFVGTKDISGFCEGEGGSTKLEYKSNLTEAIEILQDLPKSIISIIGMTNLDFMWRAPAVLNVSPMPCKVDDFELLAQRRIEQYREALVEIVFESSMNARTDQVVIAPRIFDDLWEPLRKVDGSFNSDFYSVDSFHLSNYGNSLVAKQLWNHLISPDWTKITSNEMMADESPTLRCPQENCPFIRTPLNSIDCK